jgi:hypothetical protein
VHAVAPGQLQPWNQQSSPDDVQLACQWRKPFLPLTVGWGACWELLQLGAADGTSDANTLGWAARDSGAVLSPYKFTRRALGPKDVFIKITHAGMCHSDLHTINGDWGPAKYPVVPG